MRSNPNLANVLVASGVGVGVYLLVRTLQKGSLLGENGEGYASKPPTAATALPLPVRVALWPETTPRATPKIAPAPSGSVEEKLRKAKELQERLLTRQKKLESLQRAARWTAAQREHALYQAVAEQQALAKQVEEAKAPYWSMAKRAALSAAAKARESASRMIPSVGSEFWTDEEPQAPAISEKELQERRERPTAQDFRNTPDYDPAAKPKLERQRWMFREGTPMRERLIREGWELTPLSMRALNQLGFDQGMEDAAIMAANEQRDLRYKAGPPDTGARYKWDNVRGDWIEWWRRKERQVSYR